MLCKQGVQVISFPLKIGVVVIGRNEGEHLIRSLDSVVEGSRAVVYVDSGSTDESVVIAHERGVEVVALDMSVPFTAARSRNAGFERLRSQHPEVEYVQFIDGDCEVIEGWLEAAAETLDANRVLGAEGYIISSSDQRGFLRDGQFMIEHRPMPLRGGAGVLYHVSQIWYGLHLIISALLWKADVAVVSEGSTHWFVLSLLPYFGVKVVPSVHCALWRKYAPEKMIEKLILRLNKHFLLRPVLLFWQHQRISLNRWRLVLGDSINRLWNFCLPTVEQNFTV